MYSRLFTVGLSLQLIFFSSNSFSQILDNKCEIISSQIVNNGKKYVGICEYGKANGLGKLYLNNDDIISGTFRDNTILDNFISVYSSTNKSYAFGPNKGFTLNGPCISVDFSNYVTIGNFENGVWRGSSDDFFLVNQPNFIYNSPFCAINQFDAKKTSCQLIPNSKNIIFLSAKEYNSRGDRKYWITVVSLPDNKIIKSFGSFEKPLSLNNEPEFIGFTKVDIPVFKFGGKYNVMNINTGVVQTLVNLPADLLIKKQFEDHLNTKIINDLVSLDKYELLEDSSYIKVFNNKEFDDAAKKLNPKFGSGCRIIHFNKTHEIITSREFSGFNIHDFSVDQSSGRLALSYRSKDSTFLSYFDLSSLNKSSDIFIKSNVEFDKYLMVNQQYPGNVDFSNNGTYLIYNRGSRGSTLYSGTELVFGVDGFVYGFNTNENVILANSSGTVRAYDLDKKTLIWSYKVNDDLFNTSFFNPDNEVYLISGKTTIQSFKMPDPLYSLSEFKQNPEFVKKFNIPTIQNHTSENPGQNVEAHSTNSNIKYKENQTSESCSFKFIKPKFNVKIIDNRPKCCYCNVNFADYGPGMSDEEFLRGATLDYLTEKLYLHFISTQASKEHMENDIIALAKYMQTIYPNAFAAMANLDAGYALSIINMYKYFGAPSSLASINVTRKKYSINGKFCSPEHYDKCMESQACKCK